MEPSLNILKASPTENGWRFTTDAIPPFEELAEANENQTPDFLRLFTPEFMIFHHAASDSFILHKVTLEYSKTESRF
jgi:hypothetical protein